MIGRNDRLVSAEANLLAKNTWDGDNESSEEKSCHNGESKDPLEGDSLSEELADAESGGKVAECEPHGVVLCMLA